MRIWLGLVALATLVGGCGGEGDCCAVVADAGVTIDAFDPHLEVARFGVSINRDLDVLFVIDDSPGSLPLQNAVKAAFPSFVNVLNTIEGGLPNLHLGVVSTDVGTKGALDTSSGAGIGSGPGSCSGLGKGGNLQTNGSIVVNGNFINDQKNTDGSRTTNYSVGVTLSSAFDSIASLGASGCSFVQPGHAMRRALENNPSNAGFRRPDSHLAVVFVGDHDDCSMSHSTLLSLDTGTYGPLTPFRCTRFGVTCDVGGASPDEMATEGTKSSCHSNEAAAQITSTATLGMYLSGFADASHEVFGAVIGGALTPAVVTSAPALAPSCTTGSTTAVPAIRLAQLVGGLTSSRVESACGADLSTAMTQIGLGVRSMIGTACLAGNVVMPFDCHVYQISGGSTIELPLCTSPTAVECYRIDSDPIACMLAPNQRLNVQRDTGPPVDTVVVAKCLVQ